MQVAHKVSHLDLLMGDSWDVRLVTGSLGYRAVLTLELGIDPGGQDLQVRAHAVLCPQEMIATNHRIQTLDYLRSSENAAAESLLHAIKACNESKNDVSCIGPLLGTANSLLGTANSLAWEEFDSPYDFNLSSDECSPRQRRVLNQKEVDVMLESMTSEPSTSTANNSRALDEILKKANQNSQNFYFYSPMANAKAAAVLASNSDRKKVERKRVMHDSMPSTSTPEDLSEEADGDGYATSDNLEDLTSEHLNNPPIVNPGEINILIRLI